MADVKTKIKMLDMFRLNPDKFLPLVDHAWKVFPAKERGTEWYDDPEVNIGWDTGLLDEKRPYFMECWASSGITMMTYFVSTVGIEEATTEDLVKLLTGAKLFRLLDPAHPRTSVMKFEDDNGNEFFSINVTVGMEDETYVDGGTVYPYEALNRHNRKKKRECDRHEAE